MMDWIELQSDVAAWARRNFGENPAWQPLLGLIEEIAEYLDAENGDGIGGPPIPVRMRDALGDQSIYALSLCEQVGLSFSSDVAHDPANTPQFFRERELLGTLGLACRAVLKNAQGIRGMDADARRDHLRVCLGIWFRWASWQIHEHALGTGIVPTNSAGLLPIVRVIWAEVCKRDWVKHPTDAARVASEKLAEIQPLIPRRGV